MIELVIFLVSFALTLAAYLDSQCPVDEDT